MQTTTGFQLPIPFAYVETTIPPGMTIAEYRASRPQAPRTKRFGALRDRVAPRARITGA